MRWRPARALAVVAVAGAAAAAWWYAAAPGDVPAQGSATVRPAGAGGPFAVVRVVDGDTVVVDQAGAEVRVRLLGIDTPESVKPDAPVECFGPEASARATELLNGRSVWLEADPTQDAVDRYGRTLAYVWLDETTMVNEVLVSQGYARAYVYDSPGIHATALQDAEDAAEAASAGLWAPDTCAGGR